jgi:hypothetical protein
VEQKGLTDRGFAQTAGRNSPPQVIVTKRPMSLIVPLLAQCLSSNDPLVGRTIENKYQLEKRLGAGGMGTAYCAKRLMIGDEVAVKILHSEQDDPNASHRFRR